MFVTNYIHCIYYYIGIYTLVDRGVSFTKMSNKIYILPACNYLVIYGIEIFLICFFFL